MKTAVLIDGGLVRVKLRSALRSERVARGQPIVQANGSAMRLCDFISARDFADKVVELAARALRPPEDLYRIFYYDCPPFDAASVSKLHPHPMGATIPVVTRKEQEHQVKFLNRLRVSDFFSVRTGELSFDGWAPMDHALRDVLATGRAFQPTDFKPLLRQKGIDLKIGVDVTIMAKDRLIERLILITSDSDLVPALKTARREGIQVILGSMQNSMKLLLREHVDVVRPVTI